MDCLCIPQNTSGKGGVAGGQGIRGQTSQIAQGASARSYGIPIINITTGMQAQFTVRLTMNLQGTVPSDLIDVATIQLVCRKDGAPNQALFKVPCQIVGNGLVQFKLTPKETDFNQGLHFAQFKCYNDETKLIKVFKCCIQIQRGTDGSHNDSTAPLTIAQVRMQLYDLCAQNNPILDDVQFSDIQIAWAIRRAVQDWNQLPPDLGSYTVSNFPYPAHLCQGAVYHLLRRASYRYFRNQMRHSNGGLTFDDNDKGPIYQSLAQQQGQKWDNWCTSKKTELNMMAFCGSIVDATFQPSYQPIWW